MYTAMAGGRAINRVLVCVMNWTTVNSQYIHVNLCGHVYSIITVSGIVQYMGVQFPPKCCIRISAALVLDCMYSLIKLTLKKLISQLFSKLSQLSK